MCWLLARSIPNAIAPASIREASNQRVIRCNSIVVPDIANVSRCNANVMRCNANVSRYIANVMLYIGNVSQCSQTVGLGSAIDRLYRPSKPAFLSFAARSCGCNRHKLKSTSEHHPFPMLPPQKTTCKIDRLVYKLYELTEAEIAMVKGR